MKRLVKRKRRTYPNPLTSEDTERMKHRPRDNERVFPFTEAELAFLRSLGSNDDPQPGTPDRQDDAGDLRVLSVLIPTQDSWRVACRRPAGDEIDVLRAKAAAFDRVLARTDRDLHALCEVATICMNTRVIMPEFRNLDDYTEVVDIIGAFLERLAELPGLIDGLKTMLMSTSAPVCLDSRQEELRAITAKINGILGVA